VCKAIEYELHLLPEALDMGWPHGFKPDVLAARVRLLKKGLQDVISKPQCTFMWNLLDADHGGAKIKRITSVHKQNPTAESLQPIFEATRVGYYGEQGELIMASVLDVLFPSWEVESAWIQPFDHDSFKRFVLLPECALRLIADDSLASNSRSAPSPDAVAITLEAAYHVMRESSAYGYHRF
ncbi:hypothetical protein BV20DRAFT_923221, partial [Pilatotrama ljubarskyi]